ncbi:hypothetical protein QTP88_015964 [Uroleucon formosanum]
MKQFHQSLNFLNIYKKNKKLVVHYLKIVNSENSELATEALVLMIVSLTRQFKCPIGFFYVNKINSNVLSTLISTAIIKLKEVGIQVWNVTCDGAPSNLQSFKKLGCIFDMDSLNTKFTVNNANRSIEVYSIFDTCHMLKLARSSLADKQIIQSNIGDIKWQYISSLNAFQNELGLKFANKLSSQHINYKNSIMKVKLAAQTLSSGVADAIQYLQQKGEPSFQNSDATIYFIRQIDRIFDILNSRIPFSKGYKSPINPGNINTIRSIFNDTSDYLKTLKCENNLLILGGRKMFILGFIVTMSSTIEIAYKLLYRFQNPLKYVLTYKTSQDHIELFFGCIRARGGNNNNPNCVQFKKTLRQLLYTNNIIVENGNCSYYEIPGGDILDFRSEKRNIKKSTNNDDELDVFGDEYKNLLSNIHLKEYTGEILDYIAGYIVRNISRKIVCPFCLDILIEGQSDHGYTKNINFTSFITRGKLKIVSPAVSLILKELEKSFQLIVVMQKKLHANVKTNILMLARKNILNKSNLFFFPNTHPINIELGSPRKLNILTMALNEKQILDLLNDGYNSDVDVLDENDDCDDELDILLRNFENDDLIGYLEALREEEDQLQAQACAQGMQGMPLHSLRLYKTNNYPSGSTKRKKAQKKNEEINKIRGSLDRFCTKILQINENTSIDTELPSESAENTSIETELPSESADENILKKPFDTVDDSTGDQGPIIMKEDTNMRKAIPVQERLAITLRFLASGDSFTSLSYLFKCSNQVISNIVHEVCKALVHELRNHVKVT